MSLSQRLIHRLTIVGLATVEQADHDWRNGGVLSEEPLLSNLVRLCNGQFVDWEHDLWPWFHPHRWPFNHRWISCHTEVLHRQGPKQRDKYGADLAFSLETQDFSKIAIVQFKVSVNEKARLHRSQLLAMQNSGIASAALFVLCAEQQGFSFRVNSLSNVSIPTTKTFMRSVVKWPSFGEWWVRWLNCKEGALSDSQFREALEMVTDRLQTDSVADTWAPSALVRITDARYR